VVATVAAVLVEVSGALAEAYPVAAGPAGDGDF